MPGQQALQAPEWVPYTDRVRPGDLGPGDLMPPALDDDRLADGKLSATGLERAKNSGAPEPLALIRIWLRRLRCSVKRALFYLELMPNFGVCANEYSADGRVVHATYGCGAHSETKVREEDPSRKLLSMTKDLFTSAFMVCFL